ncbi:hypothetical protein P691DRAFT_501700 [Macrolepiota fuliginosa MF-IS2]|uniref:Uncharacterized protein n=1 Tax=Macrolepiota fuliginosa MF-IS2 TaxID=1400762 RepID=A0A9P5X0E7_9AGAR|nr:hypothetical protein P691DRAFT_501700 [Macrolepiota fuliginosa MF-IS2]
MPHVDYLSAESMPTTYLPLNGGWQGPVVPLHVFLADPHYGNQWPDGHQSMQSLQHFPQSTQSAEILTPMTSSLIPYPNTLLHGYASGQSLQHQMPGPSEWNQGFAPQDTQPKPFEQPHEMFQNNLTRADWQEERPDLSANRNQTLSPNHSILLDTGMKPALTGWAGVVRL